MTEESPKARPTVARVLIDSPLPQLDRLFDYSIPAAMTAEAVPGVRVRVPLRSMGRIADGYIVAVTGPGDFTGTLSELDSVVSAARVLAPEVWTLSRRLANRAAGSASDIVRLAVPKRQVRVEKAWLLESRVEASAPVVPVPVAGFDTDRIDLALATGARLAVDAVPRVVKVHSSMDASPQMVGQRAGQWVGHWATTMAASATRALASGGSAILAVPDYRDQEQLVAALRAVLPADRIVHLDARQSNPDRYRAMLACLGDTSLVIVGNRSVLYAPATALALIAVWDEGDPLHNETLRPYVHARDIALVRQEL